jgi:hypothetical protein
MKNIHSVELSKEERIDRILANSVYLPESGLVCKLRIALRKLSANDLCNLSVIIELKVNDAALTALENVQ